MEIEEKTKGGPKHRAKTTRSREVKKIPQRSLRSNNKKQKISAKKGKFVDDDDDDDEDDDEGEEEEEEEWS
jgi:hypothetical protein